MGKAAGSLKGRGEEEAEKKGVAGAPPKSCSGEAGPTVAPPESKRHNPKHESGREGGTSWAFWGAPCRTGRGHPFIVVKASCM